MAACAAPPKILNEDTLRILVTQFQEPKSMEFLEWLAKAQYKTFGPTVNVERRYTRTGTSKCIRRHVQLKNQITKRRFPVKVRFDVSTKEANLESPHHGVILLVDAVYEDMRDIVAILLKQDWKIMGGLPKKEFLVLLTNWQNRVDEITSKHPRLNKGNAFWSLYNLTIVNELELQDLKGMNVLRMPSSAFVYVGISPLGAGDKCIDYHAMRYIYKFIKSVARTFNINSESATLVANAVNRFVDPENPPPNPSPQKRDSPTSSGKGAAASPIKTKILDLQQFQRTVDEVFLRTSLRVHNDVSEIQKLTEQVREELEEEKEEEEPEESVSPRKLRKERQLKSEERRHRERGATARPIGKEETGAGDDSACPRTLRKLRLEKEAEERARKDREKEEDKGVVEGATSVQSNVLGAQVGSLETTMQHLQIDVQSGEPSEGCGYHTSLQAAIDKIEVEDESVEHASKPVEDKPIVSPESEASSSSKKKKKRKKKQKDDSKLNDPTGQHETLDSSTESHLRHLDSDSPRSHVSPRHLESESPRSHVSPRHLDSDSPRSHVSPRHLESESPRPQLSQRNVDRESPRSQLSQRNADRESPRSQLSQRNVDSDSPRSHVSPRHLDRESPRLHLSPRHWESESPILHLSPRHFDSDSPRSHLSSRHLDSDSPRSHVSSRHLENLDSDSEDNEQILQVPITQSQLWKILKDESDVVVNLRVRICAPPGGRSQPQVSLLDIGTEDTESQDEVLPEEKSHE